MCVHECEILMLIKELDLLQKKLSFLEILLKFLSSRLACVHGLSFGV